MQSERYCCSSNPRGQSQTQGGGAEYHKEREDVVSGNDLQIEQNRIVGKGSGRVMRTVTLPVANMEPLGFKLCPRPYAIPFRFSTLQ